MNIKTKWLAVFSLMLLAARAWAALEFQPGKLWLDTDGEPIQAHGGGILIEDAKYYWYGEDRTAGSQNGVRCYSSTDLYNWKCEGVVFDVSALPQEIRGKTFIERPKVIFNSRSGKYVLWMHLEQKGYHYSRAGIAVGDRATGPFVFLKAIRPIKNDIGCKENDPNQQKEFGGTFRDMNLLVDDDGRAYVFYASEDNATMYVVRLNEELTGPETPIVEGRSWARIMVGDMREAPAPFKFNGRYYLITSGCTGWTPNAAQWSAADNILGPWETKGNPCVGAQRDTTFQSQSTFVMPLPGRPGCFIFMADRWLPRKLNDSRYVWLPVTFMSDATFKLEWKDKWDLSLFERLSVESTPSSARTYVDFNFDWKFQKGDFKRAAKPQFNDTGWRKINLPHDWSIEGPYSSTYASGTGYLPGGTGWYRKSFQLNPSLKGKVIAIEFDGIYNNSDVWINGHHLGNRPYGYSSFQYDLTEHISFAPKTNVIAVRVDHSKFADSRWYTGSGIYRNVRLIITDALHITHWGTYITTPVIDESNAQIRIETNVKNYDRVTSVFQLQSDVIDSQGRIVASRATKHTLAEGKDEIIIHQLSISNPQLWDIDSPYLYQLKSTIKSDEKIVDGTATSFGIRSFRFDPDKGFFLNGKNIKIKGVCLHHDGGCVGAAVPVEIWRSRLESLRQIGANAIRTSHNPATPEFLDLCDRMGFLVMEEAFDEFTPGKKKWVAGRNIGTPSYAGYNEVFDEWAVRDILDMVRRDRNHPSIIIWSIGNEIDYPNDPFSNPLLGSSYMPQNPVAENLTKYGRLLVNAVKQLDSTRPVTAAMSNMPVSNAVGFAGLFDVAGYNYQEKYYAKDHADFPQRCIIGSENSSTLSAWEIAEKYDFICGQFIWAGFDYLGEAGAWPNKCWTGGLFDLCGFKKPAAWFRQSIWTAEPFVYIACQETERQSSPDRQSLRSHWNWRDGAKMSVFCITNCDEVELLLNGNSISSKSIKESRNRMLNWLVPFRTGSLKAVGRQNGKIVCEYVLQTAAKNARIELVVDKYELIADGKDVSLIKFRIVDANGIVCPDAEIEVEFNVAGPAKIIGLGNSNPNSHQPHQAKTQSTWQGRGLLVLQSTKQQGMITLRANAQGLQSDLITFNTGYP